MSYPCMLPIWNGIRKPPHYTLETNMAQDKSVSKNKLGRDIFLQAGGGARRRRREEKEKASGRVNERR